MSRTLPQWLKDTINLDNEELVESLEQALNDSYRYAQKYRENPGDFIAAHQYIDTHPAFWSRGEVNPDAAWSTSGYTDKIWTEHLGSSKDYQWALEAGRSVEGDHTHHYHDLRLDAYGIPLEQAYVNLADKVHQLFRDNGIERENVEHLDTPLMKELQERLENWEAEKSKEDEETSD